MTLKSFLARRRKTEWICFLLALTLIIGCTCVVLLAQNIFGLAVTHGNDGTTQINIRTLRFVMLAVVLAFLVLGLAIGVTTKHLFSSPPTSTKKRAKKTKTEQEGGAGDTATDYTFSYNGQPPWPPAYYPGAPGNLTEAKHYPKPRPGLAE